MKFNKNRITTDDKDSWGDIHWNDWCHDSWVDIWSSDGDVDNNGN